MKTIHKLCSVVSLAFLPLMVNAATGDWPSWRGVNRDGTVVAGVPVPTELPATPKVVWRKDVGTGFSSPMVAGGRVYFMDLQGMKETLHALKATDGSALWSVPVDDAYDNSFGKGPRSSPLIDGERIYVQSCMGEFQCLSVADGKVVWRKNFVKDFASKAPTEKGQNIGASRHGNAGCALLDGENIIVLTNGPGASVSAFNKASGELVWKSQDDPAGYSSPIIATVAGVRQLIVFTAIAGIGLDPKDGKLLWRVPLKTGAGRHVATPVVIGDTVIFSSHTVGLTGVAIKKEGEALTATQVWQNKEAAINFASPVTFGEYIVGVGQASKLYCASSKTGEMLWGQREVITSPVDRAYANFIVMDKNILALNDAGEAILFAADPKEYKQISRVKLCEKNWCNPAYALGCLFLRDEKQLLCIDVMNK